MNLAELAHSFVTGQWRVDRMRTQQFLKLSEKRGFDLNHMYAGAEPGRKRPQANVLSTPEDFKQAYERIILIRAARQMEEDFGFFDGILDDFETYVVGDLNYMPNTGNADADKLIKDFLDWQFDQCDYSQRLDLCKIAQLAIRSYKRDGECGFIPIETADGLKISYVSGDRIGNPLIGANIGPNNYNGIITDDASGAPIFYDIYRRMPKMNLYTFQQRLKANAFWHLYDPFRFEQYHGVTVFKNAIENGFDMKQILDFTKLNIKWRSAQLPYVKNEQGRPRGNGYETQLPNINGVPQPLSVDVDGVTQQFLKLDDGIMDYPNDFPNTQFRGIMDELRRDIAIGAKLPLEFVYRSESGGVVQRFFVDKAEKTFQKDKRWMKKVLLNPYKNRAIQWGINSGYLNLDKFPGLSESLTRFSGIWMMGKQISVDYGKETKADLDQIDAGVMSPQEFAQERGLDLDHIRLQKKQYTLAIMQDAKEISDKTGMDQLFVLGYLNKLYPNFTTGQAAVDEADAGDAPTKPATAGFGQ